MKTLTIFFTFCFMTVAHAGLNCNVVKTSFYLYKTKSAASDIMKCTTPSCALKATKKAETNFCKALNRCEALSVELEHPCLPTNELTPEARAEIIKEAKNSFSALAEAALDFIKSLKDDITGQDKEEEKETETSESEEPEVKPEDDGDVV